MTQYLRKDFTYEYDGSGYMLFYKGQAIGGGGSIFESVHGHEGGQNMPQTPQIVEYKNRAKTDMQAILIGKPGNYKGILEKIDGVVKDGS